MKRALVLIFFSAICLFLSFMVAISSAHAQEPTEDVTAEPAPILVPCLPDAVALETTQPLSIYESNEEFSRFKATYVVTEEYRGDVACVIQGFITLYSEDGSIQSKSEFSLLVNDHADGLLGIGEASFVIKREAEWFMIIPPEENSQVVALKFGAFPLSKKNK